MSKPVRDHTPTARLAAVTWRKSTRSGQIGCCVEAAALDNGKFALRNSRDPGGPALIFSRDEMTAFLAGAKGRKFNAVANRVGSTPEI